MISPRFNALVCLALSLSAVSAPAGVNQRFLDIGLDGDVNAQSSAQVDVKRLGGILGLEPDAMVDIRTRLVDLGLDSDVDVESMTDTNVKDSVLGLQPDVSADVKARQLIGLTLLDLAFSPTLAITPTFSPTLDVHNNNISTRADSDAYVLSRGPHNLEARSPDVYDVSGDGGLAALLLGLGYPYGAEGGEGSDTYILKRQIPSLDVGSRLSSNTGLAHAASLGEGALGLSGTLNADDSVEKRQVPSLDIGSRLGLNLGLAHAAALGEGALALGGVVGVEGATDKRQLEGLGSDAGSLLSSNIAGSTSTGTKAGSASAMFLGAGSDTDVNSLLSGFGGNMDTAGTLASGFGLGN